MKLTPYTFDAPAHWASALINGDISGFSDEEDTEFNAWCQANPECHREVVSCEDDSWIGRFNGLQTDMLTYQALRREYEPPDLLAIARNPDRELAQETLMAAWNRYQNRCTRADAYLLVGDKRKGYTTRSGDFGAIAANLAAAIGCEIAGDAKGRAVYLTIAESIRDGLPADLRSRWHMTERISY